jgi:hypothetical protein
MYGCNNNIYYGTEGVLFRYERHSMLKYMDLNRALHHAPPSRSEKTSKLTFCLLNKCLFFEEKTSDDQCKYMNMVQATPKIRKGHN